MRDGYFLMSSVVRSAYGADMLWSVDAGCRMLDTRKYATRQHPASGIQHLNLIPTKAPLDMCRDLFMIEF